MLPAAQLPYVFQANMARLFIRAIAPVLDNLPVHPKLEIGTTTSLDVFLNRCASQVDNYTANEARKAYALVQVALFERQVRLWASHILAGKPVDVRHGSFVAVLDAAAAECGIDLSADRLRDVIVEAFEVGNVARHGEGRALKNIQMAAPHLIDRTVREYIDLLPSGSPDSEWLCLRSGDVARYNKVFVRFWGQVIEAQQSANLRKVTP
jgi:hypothetical protein